MTKIPEEELEKYIKDYNLCHFKKVNLFGPSNVGKKTLLSYIKHYVDKGNDFEFKDNIQNSTTNTNNNSLLVEKIEKISLTYYETKKLDINLYISNIDDIDKIKDNIETLLSNSECIIVMIDISRAETFAAICEIIPLIYTEMKKNIEYGDIPFFFLSNKIDLEKVREGSGFEIKELIDTYANVQNFEITLKLEKDANDETINNFITKICTTISESEKKYSFFYDNLNLVKIREPMTIPNDSDILQHADNTLNFLILGSQTVGKTSFAQKLFKNQFLETTLMTLGIDVIRTIAELYGNLVKIELWDTAGQERLRSIPKKYYSKGDGFFLLFDVTDRKSFDDISGWIKDIRQTRGSSGEQDFEKKPNDEVLVLIGNKIDKGAQRIVTKEEANDLAKKFDIKYYEISCKQGINIYETFCSVIFEASSQNRRESTNIVINRRKTKVQQLYHPEKKKCC
jgi:Ras-related protein Rab-8A